MKIVVWVMALVVSIIFAGSAMAVPAGKTVDWDSAAGKVVFDGKAHADKGLKCNDCHGKIFKMKKGSAEMTMESLNKGKFCGECHNGTKAFKTDDPQACAKCHKK